MNYFQNLCFCLLRRHLKFFHQISPLFFQCLLFLCTVFSDSDPESGDPRKSSFIAKQRRNAAGRTNSISVRQGGTPLNGVQLQRKSSSLKINGVNNIFHGTQNKRGSTKKLLIHTHSQLLAAKDLLECFLNVKER